MTGLLVPVGILNPIRAVLGIHHHRFNLFVKRSSGRIVQSEAGGAGTKQELEATKNLGRAGKFWMIRRFTSARIVPADAGALE
jgi:hypothetical protein